MYESKRLRAVKYLFVMAAWKMDVLLRVETWMIGSCVSPILFTLMLKYRNISIYILLYILYLEQMRRIVCSVSRGFRMGNKKERSDACNTQYADVGRRLL